jgi:hypothetical protein
MYRLSLLACSAVLLLLPSHIVQSQTTPSDSDADGLSDQLEQSLLTKFAPVLLIDSKECSSLPAEFAHDQSVPQVSNENGTIYGQAFPAKTSISSQQMVELHFYHLWKQDCGAHGHPLDAEHVSVIVRASQKSDKPIEWSALYWYAAAHEDTVCDVSQITRAVTLHAEDRGPQVWISAGKHASFLNPALCDRGCGRDRCDEAQSLAIKQIINLGEIGAPMNGALWTSSANWPLAAKMNASDFPATALARLETLPDTDIAWFNPGRHPAQGVIAISDSTADALATSGDNTITAISVAGDSTSNALEKSYRKTVRALGSSQRRIGNDERPKSKPEATHRAQ